MPHPAESRYSPPSQDITLKHVTTDACGVTTTSLGIKGKIGEWSYQKRAASTNNPKNAYGWRSPAAYSGSRGNGFIGEGSATYRRKTIGACYNTNPPTTGWIRTNVTGNVFAPTYCTARDSAWSMISVTTEEAAAKQAALQKFSDEKVNLSVAFAERKKTATLVQDSCSSLKEAFSELKKWNSARKIVKSIGDLWLSYRYGWMPALMDVHGAVKAIEDRDNGTYNRYIVTTRSRRNKSETASRTHESTIGGYAPVTVTYSLTRNLTVSVRADAALTNATYRRLQDVGVTDPITTAWELLPYSFVVDWFLGVGDFLDGVNALKGYTFLGASTTKCQKSTAYGVCKPSSNSTYVTESCAGSAFNEDFVFSRSVGNFGSSQLLLKSNPLNLVRTFDSIALLGGVLGRNR